jgi:D-glycero-alpha-D-manno-heptose-7-phosphate kinase
MIITRTPMRISFIGGGSDLPAYYREYGPGAVIGMAIDKYVYVMVNEQYEGRVLAHYRETENVATVKELRHDRMRACLTSADMRDSIEVTSMADMPGGMGLGASSAFTVGLMNALAVYADPVTLAKKACQIEINDLGLPIGKQDQYLCAMGGFRFLQFHADERVEIDSVPLMNGFIDHLLLLALPVTHDASALLREQAAAMSDEEKRSDVRELVNLAYSFREALATKNYRGCGVLMDLAWLLKRGLTPHISNETIDYYYHTARRNGAYGGKLCGAGGGGCMLFIAPPDTHQKIIESTGLRHVLFRMSVTGSEVIYAF